MTMPFRGAVKALVHPQSPVLRPPQIQTDRVIAELLGGTGGLASLSQEKTAVAQAQLGESHYQELISLARESDPALFGEGLLRLAQGLSDGDRLEWAVKLYDAVERLGEVSNTHGLLRNAAQKADQSQKALLGQGAAGARFEFLLKRFTKDATDYRTILPMMVGSLVGALVETAVLGRLAGTARSVWAAGRWTPRLAASASGYVSEFSTFGLLNFAFADQARAGLSEELARSALSLGALRLAGFLGKQAFLRLHGLDELGMPMRLKGLANFDRIAIPQAASFAGLLLSHQLEEGLGLRPKVDDATAVTDTLAAMLSLGAGARLGHEVLGPRFLRWQRELQMRAGSCRKKIIASEGLPFRTRLDPTLLSMLGVGTGLTVLTGSDLAQAAVKGFSEGVSQGETKGLLASLVFGAGVWAVTRITGEPESRDSSRDRVYRLMGTSSPIKVLGGVVGEFGGANIHLQVLSTPPPIEGRIPPELAHALLKSFKVVLSGQENAPNLPKGDLVQQLTEGDRLMGILSNLKNPRLGVKMKADGRLLEVKVYEGAEETHAFRDASFFSADELPLAATTQEPQELEPSPDSPPERQTIFGFAVRGKARAPASEPVVEVYVSGQRVVFSDENPAVLEVSVPERESDAVKVRDTEEDRPTDAPITKPSPKGS